ncbi:FadR/GntR family transcriptional regulator [Aliiroseovarius sp. 2305UL8-7]|uniref:FadR/GntR family transcriptional regulator n=1 Tax=Aliiroseovarius conchicola TaxID=3121637 RepID=UPI003527BFA1
MLNLPQDRLYQKVAADLAARIAQGEFNKAERLPTERALSEMLSVSRTTVREALLVLELHGLVEIRGGSGSYVVDTGPGRSLLEPVLEFGTSIRDSLEIRMCLEVQLAGLAAERRTDDNLATLQAALNRGWEDFRNETFRHDPKDDPDGVFHVEVARAAQNATAAHLIRELWNVMRSPLSEAAENLVQIEQYAELSLLDHDRILAALIARDASAARDAMQRHLTRYQKIIGWADQPAY